MSIEDFIVAGDEMAEILICPGCGAEVSDENSTCMLCGGSLSGAGAASNGPDRRDEGPSSFDAASVPGAGGPSAAVPEPKKSAFAAAPAAIAMTHNVEGPPEDISVVGLFIIIIAGIIGLVAAAAISLIICLIAGASLFRGAWRMNGFPEYFVIYFGISFVTASILNGARMGGRLGKYLGFRLKLNRGAERYPDNGFYYGTYAGGFAASGIYAIATAPLAGGGYSYRGDDIIIAFPFISTLCSALGAYFLGKYFVAAPSVSGAAQEVRRERPDISNADYGRGLSVPYDSAEYATYVYYFFAGVAGMTAGRILLAPLLFSRLSADTLRMLGESGANYLILFIVELVMACAGVFAYGALRGAEEKEAERAALFVRDNLAYIAISVAGATFLRLPGMDLVSPYYGFSGVAVSVALETVGAYIGLNVAFAIDERTWDISKYDVRPHPASLVVKASLAGLLAALVVAMALFFFFGMPFGGVTQLLKSALLLRAAYFLVALAISGACVMGIYFAVGREGRR